MITLRTVAEMRAWPRTGTLGLVPTMGAFHAGHLSLIDAARAQNDHVVVWLFVNPAQFDEPADLAAYPRDEARDARLAAERGADVLYAPAVEEVYPPGFATTVTVGGLADTLEGAHRPGHFAGVATVVAKMLNQVRPDRAYFGAKDAQQVALVRRLARDLDIPAEIVALPIVRERDGLAMSSRNVHLSAAEREQAGAINRALRAAATADDPEVAALTALRDAGIEPEYVAVVDPDTFEPARAGLITVAARVGDTRLIDNMEGPGMTRTMLKSKIHRATITAPDISYAQYTRADLEHYEPRVVHVDRDNAIIAVDDQVATLLEAQS